MTMLNAPRSRPLGALKAGGLGDIENTLPLLPIPVGFVVAVMSLMAGCSIGYAVMQAILFTLVCPVLYLMKFDDRFTSTVLLVSMAKIFFISQFVSLLIFRAPDIGLMKPVQTALAIAAGLLSASLGIGAAALLTSVIPPYQPLLRLRIDANSIRRLGFPTAAVGLTAQAIWSLFAGMMTADQHGGLGGTVSGIAAFSDLAPLSLFSICCFGASTLMETNGKKLISKELIVVLSLYILLIIPLASKAEPLKPIVALSVLAVVYKWRPSAGLVAAALAVLIFVAEFLYPTITLARLRAFGEQRPLPIVFVETAIDCVTDFSNLEYAKTFTKNYDRTVGAFYYGKPYGFLDRFTPLVTDKLVVASSYKTNTSIKDFGAAAASVLPSTLGFKRDTTSVEGGIEAALHRKNLIRGKVGWDNTGFVGTGYLSGRLPMVIAVMFSLGFLASMAARTTFGPKGGTILWIPYLVAFMLIPADMAFSVAPALFCWGWIILTVGLTGIIMIFGGRSPLAPRPAPR